jgi:ribosome-binding factor A
LNFREQKLEELLKHLAADFLQRESNVTSLITVTGIRLSERLTKADILITVFPEQKQEEALDFTKRKRTEFREYVREHAKMRVLPFFDFEIDFGEKNRQRIDELSG